MVPPPSMAPRRNARTQQERFRFTRGEVERRVVSPPSPTVIMPSADRKSGVWVGPSVSTHFRVPPKCAVDT